MKNVLILTLAAGCLSAQPLFARPLIAQRGASANSLAGARAYFDLADVDKDGKITFEELKKQRFPIEQAQFDAMDVDKSSAWSRDEFVVFYRRFLIANNYRPAADLDAEVTRVEASRKAKEAETRRAAPDVKDASNADDRLQIAIDELELKTAKRQATRADFQGVRDLMTERAKASASSPSAEAPDLQAKFDAAMTALETKAKAGNYSREDFNELRALLIQRARASTQTGSVADFDPKLQTALDDLEKKAALRQATRADFDHVNDVWKERAKLATPQDPAVTPELQARFEGALASLEAQAKQGNYSREEFGALRNLLIQHARGAANADAAAPVASTDASGLDARLQSALDDLERKAKARQATREDFDHVRDAWVARAKAASAGETPAAAAQSSALAQQFATAMDELEKNALAGNWSPEQFAAIQQSYIHRARAASGGSAPAPAPTSAASGSVQQRFDEALNTLQEHALGRGATREDYQRVKDLLVAHARESVKAADATSAVDDNDPRVTALATKLGAAIDQLEEQARAGKITRADFDKFRQMYVNRARAAVNATETPTEDASGKGVPPVSTPPVRGPGSRAGDAKTPPANVPESKGPASGRGAEKDKQPPAPAPTDKPKPDDGSSGREKPPPHRG